MVEKLVEGVKEQSEAFPRFVEEVVDAPTSTFRVYLINYQGWAPENLKTTTSSSLGRPSDSAAR